MARYSRALQKIFGGSASNIGTYGSAAAGSPVSGASPALSLVQSLSQYLNGWSAATLGASKFPALEDMNALGYLFSSQLAYILQQGIAEYDATTTYFQKNIVCKAGTYILYGSVTDNNVGNALTDVVNWVQLVDLSAVATTVNVYTGGTTTGAANAQVVSPVNPAATSFTNGQSVICTAGFSNTASMTFGAGGETPITVKKDSPTGLVVLALGDVIVGNTLVMTKNIAGSCWVLTEGLPIKNAAYYDIGKGMLADGSGNLSYGSPESSATGTNRPPVVGDWNQTIARSNSGTNMSDVLPSGGSLLAAGWQATYCNADTAAILTFTTAGTIYNPGISAAVGSVILNPGDSVTFSAFASGYIIKNIERNTNFSRSPVKGSVANLAAAWASNTTATLTADEAMLEDSNGNVLKVSSSNVTFNSATSGANGLDTGAIANSTWYYGYLIFNPTTGTTACLFSTSATAPTMPAGYTYKSPALTAFRTDGSAHFLGFMQFGRDWQYTVGNNLAAIPLMANGAVGNTGVGPTVAIAVGVFVPTTAKVINVFIEQATNSTILAPNANYGAAGATTNCPPLVVSSSNQTAIGELLLESSNIYWASAGGFVFCLGFRLNF